MTIWFTSDTHFNHAKILQYTSRTHSSIAEMNADLITKFNSVVGSHDVVWHLGDFAFGQHPDVQEDIFARLHGQKHLIFGNHDDKKVMRLPWSSQQAYAEIKINKHHIVLFHYAIVSWNRYRHGALHLHGHHHATLPAIQNRFDVGVDAWDMYPVSFERIEALSYEFPSRQSSE